MAIINKSYESVEVLAKLGFRPKQTLLENAQSPYLTQLFEELDRSAFSLLVERTLKLCFIPLTLLSQYIIADINPYLVLLTILIFFFLAAKMPGKDSTTRPTAFYSSLVNR
jgi:hypothetical protein